MAKRSLLSRCPSYNHMAYVVPWSRVLAFVTTMSKKHKSTSPTAIWVKNQRKTISIEEKLDVTSWLERKVKELLTYPVMLDSLILTNIQFKIMLLELQKMLSGTKAFVQQDCHSPIRRKCTKNYGWKSFKFLCII